jgi:hypothetical protein
MNRDYTPSYIREMNDALEDVRGNRYMERARQSKPNARDTVLKRVALAYCEAEEPALFLALRKNIGRWRPEPTRSSPIEQLKGLTSILNEYGELTGGNYRSSL